MRNSIRASLCAVVVSLLAACGGGGGGGGGGFPIFPGAGGSANPPTSDGGGVNPPISRPFDTTDPLPPVLMSPVVSGKVSSPAGAPVEGFIVSAGGQSATTGADGSYSLSLASPATSTVLLAAKSGYQTMAKQVGLLAGVTTTQNITAYPEGVRTTFAATSGKIVIVNGAVIDIPANAIKDAAGNPYTGVVTISASYNNPTTAAGNDAFPQPYAGLDGGNEVTLQSLGVIEAKLFAADGSPLQLSQPAKLVYPGVDSISTAATIPLWYYDEAKMTWVREGTATRDARDGSYSGTVTHFTQWNLDTAFGPGYSSASITACVKFAGGESSRYGILATLSGPGFSWSNYTQPLASGNFDLVRAPVDQAMILTFSDASGAPSISVAVPPTPNGGNATLPCVTLVGSATPVPPPPPQPPVPVPAGTPATTFNGVYEINFGTRDFAATADQGWVTINVSYGLIGTAAGLNVVGTPYEPEMPFSVTGQVVAGGYLTMTGTGSPRGAINFTGQFGTYPELGPDVFVPTGAWLYATPPADGQPAQTYFERRVFEQ